MTYAFGIGNMTSLMCTNQERNELSLNRLRVSKFIQHWCGRQRQTLCLGNLLIVRKSNAKLLPKKKLTKLHGVSIK
jgi:hypothetical protein